MVDSARKRLTVADPPAARADDGEPCREGDGGGEGLKQGQGSRGLGDSRGSGGMAGFAKKRAEARAGKQGGLMHCLRMERPGACHWCPVPA
eukprot:366403-Chlamydomonas_euryale.AAC.1